MDDKYLGVGDVAKRLGVRPHQVTALFYERRLRDDVCPIVSGRRIIPESYVRVIAVVLRRKGIEVVLSVRETDGVPSTQTRG